MAAGSISNTVIGNYFGYATTQSGGPLLPKQACNAIAQIVDSGSNNTINSNLFGDAPDVCTPF